ncbi:MAG: 4-hydroxy-3-methylbut-2-enyl diphosphate reductase [Planctomycetota bacterium]
MRITVAKTAGFCMGVRRALDLVFDAARARARGPEGSPPLSTLGHLIHNHQALEALEAHGVRVAKDLSEIDGGTVVIRAHGAGPTLRAEIAERLDLDAIDATCPRVVRCQRTVERASAAGRQVVIAGDTDHAEVEALVDFAGGRALVVSSVEDARKADLAPPVTLLAQTTFNSRTFAEMADVLRERVGAGDGAGGGTDAIEVVNSLCRSTEDRQAETAELARGVDAVVVVGGRHSANTRRLAEVARSLGRPTFHVETADELASADFAGVSSVGVTAGASTPAWVTERVVERLSGMRSPARRAARRALEALVGSNVLLAGGAASVTLAASLATSTPLRADVLFVAFAYVFWAYAANRAGADARALASTSGRASFFLRHSRGLLLVAGALVLGALALVFVASPLAGGVLAAATALAGLYSLRVLPARVRPRDVPGSKDVMIALAWAFVAVGVPLLAAPGGGGGPRLAHALVAAGVFVLSFSAATALSLGDVQSDRLIGNESVAVLLGVSRARGLAAAGAALVMLVAGGLAAAGLLPAAAASIAASAALILVPTVRRRRPGDALAVELAIQTALLAAGPAALAAARLWGS